MNYINYTGVTTQPLYDYDHNMRGSLTYTTFGDVIEGEVSVPQPAPVLRMVEINLEGK